MPIPPESGLCNIWSEWFDMGCALDSFYSLPSIGTSSEILSILSSATSSRLALYNTSGLQSPNHHCWPYCHLANLPLDFCCYPYIRNFFQRFHPAWSLFWVRLHLQTAANPWSYRYLNGFTLSSYESPTITVSIYPLPLVSTYILCVR